MNSTPGIESLETEPTQEELRQMFEEAATQRLSAMMIIDYPLSEAAQNVTKMIEQSFEMFTKNLLMALPGNVRTEWMMKALEDALSYAKRSIRQHDLAFSKNEEKQNASGNETGNGSEERGVHGSSPN